MSTDVREQIRQLTAAFDAFVEDVSVDEIVSSSAPMSADGRLVGLGPVGVRQGSDDRRPRVVGVAAAVLLVVGLVGALGLAMRSDSDSRGGSAPSEGPSALSTALPTATSYVTAPVAGSVGSFVWPMDDREFVSLNELVGAFASEVLAWTAFDVEGDTNAENAPQGFDLVNTTTGARIQMIAAPLEQAWGFMQIGDGVEASVAGGGTIVVRFPRNPQAVSSSVTALLSDGSVVELSTTTDQFDIATGALEDLASVLILGRDDTGAVVSVAGGMFAGNPETPETAVAGSVPGATAPDDAPPTTLDPLVFAGTESWPSMSVSVPPASTSGYGMQLCDSGYGTKILRLDSPTDTSHAYSGTLCVFIELVQPRADATVSCSTSTPLYNYARCARRTDRTDSAGGGTAATAAATTEQQDAMHPFPSATDWSESEVFAVVVSSATNATVQFADSKGSISLTPAPESAEFGVDQPGVCFVIELETTTANGCVGRGLLATGLAYGAFRDGNGAIELVGIVPDDVTTIDIGGTRITPVGNIWHTTLDSGEVTPRITARSADGRESSTT